jgi:flagellar protein FliS
MDLKLRNYYLETRINGASPGQVLIMLYDGLIDQAELADQKLVAPNSPGDLSLAAQAISHCINIMTELSASLKHSVDPALCGTLSNLYLFFTQEFSAALERREPRKIRAILPLIRELRDTWFEADRRANRGKPLEVALA